MSGRFILRTPLLKLEQLPIIEEIISVFSNAILREALYIASPDLYNELLKIEKNEIKNKTEISKIKKSLFKYYTRLCTRATPFGMFAGICVGQFENSTLIKFKDELVTNTRLDLGLLFNLYFEVSKIPQVFNNLLYSPNNTMYKVKNKWRYIEFKIHDNKRFHELVTIDDNEILSFIVESLNKTPHSIDEICEIIINFGFEKSEAKEYTESLIGNQILVSQIFPSVTGDNYEKKFFNLLAKIYPEKFKGIGLRLEKVLNNKNVNAINKVKSVKQILSSFSILTEETDLIQVDLLKKTNYCILDRNIKKRIEDCTLILANLNPEFNDYYRILNFKKKFYDRYEEALIPLSLVLDADIGIDYNAKNIKSNDGNSFDRGADMDFKLKLYRESLLKQSLSIEIFEDDIKPYIHMKNRKIPDSLSFFGSFLLEESQTTIIYQYAGGPSALNLLGRFGYLSNELSSLCEEIASSETLNNKDAILAEIAHLPMLRLGNVIYRPHYREYEIPLLAYSDLPLAKQIPLSDLMVGIRNDKVVLYSKSLKREVIPMLSSAHNYFKDNIPLYNFLCDLKDQGAQNSISWSWGFLHKEPFLPRITYKNTIFSLATWNLDTSNFRILISQKKDLEFGQFEELISKYHLPSRFSIVSGENHLLIDIRVKKSFEIFIDFCKKYEKLKIIEFLFDKNNTTDGFINELIVPLTKINNSVKKPKNFTEPINKRRFSPMSNWVYVKLFTGKLFSDEIIINNLNRIIEKLSFAKIINKWFFIRYDNPYHHLRIRFEVINLEYKNELFKLLDLEFNELFEENIIWNIQLDTYNKEIERYGSKSIGDSEEWFCQNSIMVMKLLKLLNTKSINEQLSFILICVYFILEDFKLEDDKKLFFCDYANIYFLKEFNLDNNKLLRNEIAERYRDCSKLIFDLFDNNYLYTEKINFEYAIKFQSIETKRCISEIIKNNSSEKISEIIGSLIHMFINRYFSQNQRYYEMIIYIWLKKYLTSKLARIKYKV